MNLIYKGTTIFYTDEGSGDTIVFLHGFLENSKIWTPFLPEISKKHRVVCIDLLGHGKTGCLGYIHTMELMADVIEAVLNHLKINTSIMIGHSMGGYVALAYAQKKPNALRGLCLMNSTASNDDEEKQKNRERAILAVKKNSRTFIRIAIINLFSSNSRILYSKEINKLIIEALKTPLQGVIAALEGMRIRKDRKDVFQQGSFSKTIIFGKQDLVIDYNSLVIQAKNSNASLVEFLGGHMSYIENKNEFLNEIMHFIENI